MELPNLAFLIVYLIVIGAFLLMAFFNLYHVFKFGLFDIRAKLMAFIFIAFTAAVIAFTMYMLRDVDWSQTVTLF